MRKKHCPSLVHVAPLSWVGRASDAAGCLVEFASHTGLPPAVLGPSTRAEPNPLAPDRPLFGCAVVPFGLSLLIASGPEPALRHLEPGHPSVREWPFARRNPPPFPLAPTPTVPCGAWGGHGSVVSLGSAGTALVCRQLRIRVRPVGRELGAGAGLAVVRNWFWSERATHARDSSCDIALLGGCVVRSGLLDCPQMCAGVGRVQAWEGGPWAKSTAEFRMASVEQILGACAGGATQPAPDRCVRVRARSLKAPRSGFKLALCQSHSTIEDLSPAGAVAAFLHLTVC